MSEIMKTPPKGDAEPGIVEQDAGVTPADLRKDMWSGNGSGEELALREAKHGSEADTDDMSDLVAAETSETVRRISDPHIYTDAEKKAQQSE